MPLPLRKVNKQLGGGRGEGSTRWILYHRHLTFVFHVSVVPLRREPLREGPSSSAQSINSEKEWLMTMSPVVRDASLGGGRSSSEVLVRCGPLGQQSWVRLRPPTPVCQHQGVPRPRHTPRTRWRTADIFATLLTHDNCLMEILEPSRTVLLMTGSPVTATTATKCVNHKLATDVIPLAHTSQVPHSLPFVIAISYHNRFVQQVRAQ